MMGKVVKLRAIGSHYSAHSLYWMLSSLHPKAIELRFQTGARDSARVHARGVHARVYMQGVYMQGVYMQGVYMQGCTWIVSHVFFWIGPYGNHGCTCGSVINTYLYIIDNGGIDTAASYPYKSKVSWNLLFWESFIYLFISFLQSNITANLAQATSVPRQRGLSSSAAVASLISCRL